MRPAPVLMLCLLGMCAACTRFPELDAVESPDVQAAEYPALLPIETLLASDPPTATPEMQTGIDARAEALRRRAGALRGPVLDDTTRTRLDDARS